MIEITMPNLNGMFVRNKTRQKTRQILSVPSKAGVYFIYHKKQEDYLELLYIGQTQNLRERISQHLSGRSHICMNRNLFYRIEWFKEYTSFNRDLYERYFIHTLKPLLNYQLNKKYSQPK